MDEDRKDEAADKTDGASGVSSPDSADNTMTSSMSDCLSLPRYQPLDTESTNSAISQSSSTSFSDMPTSDETSDSVTPRNLSRPQSNQDIALVHHIEPDNVAASTSISESLKSVNFTSNEQLANPSKRPKIILTEASQPPITGITDCFVIRETSPRSKKSFRSSKPSTDLPKTHAPLGSTSSFRSQDSYPEMEECNLPMRGELGHEFEPSSSLQSLVFTSTRKTSPRSSKTSTILPKTHGALRSTSSFRSQDSFPEKEECSLPMRDELGHEYEPKSSPQSQASIPSTSTFRSQDSYPHKEMCHLPSRSEPRYDENAPLPIPNPPEQEHINIENFDFSEAELSSAQLVPGETISFRIERLDGSSQVVSLGMMGLCSASISQFIRRIIGCCSATGHLATEITLILTLAFVSWYNCHRRHDRQ